MADSLQLHRSVYGGLTPIEQDSLRLTHFNCTDQFMVDSLLLHRPVYSGLTPIAQTSKWQTHSYCTDQFTVDSLLLHRPANGRLTPIAQTSKRRTHSCCKEPTYGWLTPIAQTLLTDDSLLMHQSCLRWTHSYWTVDSFQWHRPCGELTPNRLSFLLQRD
jgi:hypothetical protein